MKISEGIEVLEVAVIAMGKESVIYPVVIWDKVIMALIDTGYPGQMEKIKDAIKSTGKDFDKINRVVITHHDIDHIGGIKEIIKELPGKVKILAHEIEAPYINGEKKPLKLAKMEEMLDKLPENMKSFYGTFKAAFENCKADIDGVLTDGEVLPYNGGVTVVFTPGHTLGHICLYHKGSKTLIAGDLLAVKEGRLVKTDDSINFDPVLAKNSLMKLRDFDIETVVCYHGGIYRDNVNQAILELSK